jgi:dihydropteroate synthase
LGFLSDFGLLKGLRLKARHFEFAFPRPALVMGIVNVTPDSFSDGGRFLEPEAAADQALKLVAEGAEIIDVGGESTRPGAIPVPEAEEMRRVMPVLERLAGRISVPISVDTMKPGVARAALQAGASIVNDVAANREEPAMWQIVAESGAGYVCVHMQGTPQNMQLHPVYANVVSEVKTFFDQRVQQMNGCGVASEQIILDPGIGFGKTVEQNLQILAALRKFAELERPLLLGVSRKSFLGRIAGVGEAERLPAGLACAALAVEAGVRIIRTHDVASTRQAMRMAEAILAEKKS